MKDTYVKTTTLVLIISMFLGILGIIWNKLEKIDDVVGQVKTDVAVIKSNLGIKATSSSLLNRFYGN